MKPNVKNEETRLSSKGQVIIPKSVRTRKNWKVGQDFTVLETKDGLLLKPKQAIHSSTLDEVAGSLPYRGKAKSLEQIQRAIAKGARQSFS